MLLADLARYAQMAADSYLPADHVPTHGDRQWTFHRGSTAGFVAQSDDRGETVIVLRGTDDYVDALLDMECVPRAVDYLPGVDGVLAHRGFTRYAVKAASAIAGYELPGRVTIVGHSLGGAAAVLLPLIWPIRGGLRVVTFGAPRAILDGSVARYPHIDSVTHVRHSLDVVPDLPFRVPGGRYKYSHVGQTIWLTERDTIATEASGIARRISRGFRMAGHGLRGAISTTPIRSAMRAVIEAGVIYHSIHSMADTLTTLAAYEEHS